VAEFFRDLEKEWCGEENYWRPPVFKGRMEMSGWWSPYQTSLMAGFPRVSCDYATMLVAVMDYVSGMGE